ncbi:MAG: hypothetical protein WDZ80_07490 [Candidatus Paceibacterota bacterium]
MNYNQKKILFRCFVGIVSIVLLVIAFLSNFPHNLKALCWIVLIFFWLTYILDWLSTKENFKKRIWLIAFVDFVSPFYRGPSQWTKLGYLIIIILIVPLIIVVISDNGNSGLGLSLIESHFNFNNTIDPNVFWGIWLTVLSIFISSRIYFEVIYKMKHNLEEFLTNVTQFLHETDSDNEIYFILPTLYIGASEYNGKVFDRFKDKLFSICDDDEKTVHIAMLDYKADGLSNFCNELKELKSSSNDFAVVYDKVRGYFKKETSLLEDFHYNWKPLKNGKNSEEWCDYFSGLYYFLDRLNNYSADKVVLEKIKSNYFNDGNKPGIGNKDFFLFANVTEGVYYFGDVVINAQSSIYFEGTILRNQHLSPGIEALYHGFVDDRLNPPKQ